MVAWELLIVLAVLLFGLIFTGIPVAFAFIIVNVIGFTVLVGFENGITLYAASAVQTLASFSLLPIPLFVLMGELLYRSGIATRMVDAVSKWLGALPGRLSILALFAGAIFAMLSGSAVANTATLGSTLVPEMRERGYSKGMAVGPILAAASLAVLIPPSALAVLLGAIGGISVRGLLVAIIVPGVLLGIGSVIYILVYCTIKPEAAPRYEVATSSLSERLRVLVTDILPALLILFLVVGTIFFGVATPSEAAALGVAGVVILMASYRLLTWASLRDALFGTVKTSGLIFLLVAGAAGFSQILALSRGVYYIADFVAALQLSSIVIIFVMLIVVLLMGMVMDAVSIMLVTLPVFMPVVGVLEIDPLWFGVMMLINLELAHVTPPFGLQLYVMQGVTPAEFQFGDVVRGMIPFFFIEVGVLLAVVALPILALWLPSLM